MRSDAWGWGAAGAVLGTLGYRIAYRPEWRNPVLLLYDVPVCAVTGAAGATCMHELPRDAASWRDVAGLAGALVIAAGARYRSWPISGHLTLAVTVALLALADRNSPSWWRATSLLPVGSILLIRTVCPQSALMGDALNTVRALLAGTAIACAATFGRF